MKKLKFQSNLVEQILSGEKTSTWRIDDDKEITVGDLLSMVDSTNGRQFCRAKVTEVYEKTFDKLESSDRSGHESYENEEQMYEIYSQYYKKRIGPHQKLKIIRYELL